MTLSTFKTPSPNVWVLRATHPLNDVLFLKGLPLLNKMPGIKHIPFIGRGVCRLRDISYTPISERVSLKGSINFVGPNHPEFFTDWMLDKYLVGKKDVMMASWAAHTVVNGMGPKLQKFWLANNLIAQIPGSGNVEGKAYALSQALKGHTVLMHPEGKVHWTGKRLSSLYSGIAELALNALQSKDPQDTRPVMIHTPAWCFRITNETEASLVKKFTRELDDIGAYFDFNLVSKVPADPVDMLRIQRAKLGGHLYRLHNYILCHEVKALGITIMYKQAAPHYSYGKEPTTSQITAQLGEGLSYRAIEQELLRALVNKVYFTCHTPLVLEKQDKHTLLANFQAWKKTMLYVENTTLSKDAQKLVKRVDALLGNITKFDVSFYDKAFLSAEEFAECLQRIRTSYCKGDWMDTLHKFVPAPLTDRNCYVHWGAPLDVSAWAQAQAASDITAANLMQKVEENLTQALQAVQAHADLQSSELFQRFTPNPWKG